MKTKILNQEIALVRVVLSRISKDCKTSEQLLKVAPTILECCHTIHKAIRLQQELEKFDKTIKDMCKTYNMKRRK